MLNWVRIEDVSGAQAQTLLAGVRLWTHCVVHPKGSSQQTLAISEQIPHEVDGDRGSHKTDERLGETKARENASTGQRQALWSSIS